MGEQYFVLEKTWQTHFNRQLAAANKKDPTAAELRRWMDLPRERGLAPEVGNLLILAFAEQTNRSFSLRGRPSTPTLDHLPDEAELKLQSLPTEEQWDEARRRAKEIFGVGGFESAILTASNVAVLTGKIRDVLDLAGKATRPEMTARDASRELVREIAGALAHLGLAEAEIEKVPRCRTARAVEAMIKGLVDNDTTLSVLHLVGTSLDTSASAMGRSLANMADIVGSLRSLTWDLFDGVARLDDDRAAESRALLTMLREALEADEYVIPIGPKLEEARTKAIRLLAARRPSPPVRVDRKPRTDGVQAGTWKTIQDGASSITPENWEEEIASLASLVKAGGKRRLTLNWSLEEESP
jgi:hypothetical protein